MPTLRLCAAFAAALAFAFASSVSPAEAQTTVRSGPLVLHVQHDPFALELRDRSSGEVLRSVRAGAPSPTNPHARYGPLGYSFDLRIPLINNAFLGYYIAAEVPTVWFHGTRVQSVKRDGKKVRLGVATNDPLGHDLLVTITPRASGVITVSSRIEPGSGAVPGLANLASVSGAAFERARGERFIGFGERSNAADQTGNEVFNWAEEGPFSSGVAEDVLRPLIPEFTFPTGPTGTNFPMPWALSTRGLGFLIDQTHRSRFRLASDRDDAWQAEAETAHFRFTVFAGPTPARALRRYSDYAGRQPNPAPWIFGPWFQPTMEKRPYELADRFRDENVPVTVAQTYTHYLPCGAHVGRDDVERLRVRNYHRRGYKVTTYFNPHICATYKPVHDEAARRGLLVRNMLGQPYLMTNPFTADQIVSEIDFTHPEAQDFFGGLLDEAIDAGYDGWMEDFGEYTPTDSHFHNGKGGLEMHNRYPVEYHCASYRHTRKRMGRDAAAFIRSGWHGVQPCARVVWGGDPTEDWSCADGLCAALHQALSIGASGIAYWGTDIGGFHALVNPRTSAELNIRWLQLGAVLGVMRTQANGYSLADNRAERSQVWHPDVMPIWRRYARLRTQLFPYVWEASRAYQRTGLPITRHLALTNPRDKRAVARQDEFMFGPDILAAPVVERGQRERDVYLPAGRWIDLWRSAGYARAGTQLRLHEATVLPGRATHRVPAPLGQLPLFIRAGAILPLLPGDVDTLADVGRKREGLVRLADGQNRRLLYAFPRRRSQARLAPGRITSRETRAGWRLRARGPRREYRLQAAFAAMRAPFRPCGVRVNGRALPPRKWRWHQPKQTLRLRFTAARADVLVERCR